jgi:translation initiation factor IF-2
VDTERKARQISQSRIDAMRDKKSGTKQHIRLENVVESLHEGSMLDLKIVLKADTQGSVEAVSELLSKLAYVHVKLMVIHSGVGAITETDVMLADASDAIVIGFNVRPTEKAKQLALKEKIDLRLYNIIYEVADNITAAVKGMLKPRLVEKTVGRAEVRNSFKVSKIGTIAGCMVMDGQVKRGMLCRLLRDNVVVFTSTVSSLRRFKDDVREVQSGYECGIGIENYNDIKVGDVIEVFIKEEVAQQVTA